jgi:photosystem II stability/assembly factor-like uncharacterized protein
MKQMVRGCLGAALILFLVSGGRAARTQPAAPIHPSLYAGLQWRLVGPFRGGRVLAVSGVGDNPTLFYFGAVDGGVWKTDDAGRTWQPIFDDQPISSIGALAVAPSDPRRMYVGTGEADMRSDITFGDGMYVSSDGGRSWRRSGLSDTRHIGWVEVDPHDARRVFVAALGHAYGPNAERGVFRSLDGGATWQRVLFLNADTGAIDVKIDPGNPQHLLAALWQTRRPPWNIYQPSNGPGSGLYESRDGGASWHRVVAGLPRRGLGRMGIAFAPSRPQRIYLVVDAARGGLYRSDDGGRRWRRVNADRRLWSRGWYFCGVTVDPHDPDTVYVNDTALYRSHDGGLTFTAIKGSPDGDDFHTLWIDPRDPQRMISGSDQGASISLNGGRTWSTWYNQPTGQFYHIATDTAYPFSLYGAQQDSGAAAALSRSAYSSLTFRDWRAIAAGGESDMLAPDPLSAATVFGGRVERYDLRTSQDQIVDPTLAYPQIVWRQTWTLPLAFSPADPHALYFGRQVLFRTHDGGKTWHIISPDLTRPHPGVPPTLDPATATDTLGIGPRRGVIYSIAPSPLQADVIWAGTDDGLIWRTADGGEHWHNVTPAGLGSWSKVTGIEASPFDPACAYAAVDRHRLEDPAPYLYRTCDGGAHWQVITQGLPRNAWLNAVRADPAVRGLLYAGTETGVMVSFDDGENWLPLQLNLPVVSVRDLSVRGDSLAVATHGRGFWVLDDLAPLRQMAAAAVARGPYLFAPAAAIRVRPGNDQGERLPPEEPAAPNPPTGALIDYELPAGGAARVDITISDAAGQTVAAWSSSRVGPAPNPNDFPFMALYIPHVAVPTTRAGLNQFVWDFHVSAPPDTPGGGQAVGPLAPPGGYTVTLTVDGAIQRRRLTILKDPRIEAGDADLQAQYRLALQVEESAAHLNRAYRLLNAALDRLLQSRSASAQACLRRLRAIAGAPASATPDNSVGYPETNLTSLHYVMGQLMSLEAMVESADVAPTPDARRTFAALEAAGRAAMDRIPAGSCGVTPRPGT